MLYSEFILSYKLADIFSLMASLIRMVTEKVVKCHIVQPVPVN